MSPVEATEKLLAEVESASLEEVQTLLEAGAEPNAKGWKDMDGTALMWAAMWNRNPEVFRALLAAGADPNATNKDSKTPLDLARESGNTAVVKILEQLQGKSRRKAELQYYKILEVEPGANFLEIKKAYHERVQEYHPDKVAHLGAALRSISEQKMKEINEAYS